MRGRFLNIVKTLSKGLVGGGDIQVLNVGIKLWLFAKGRRVLGIAGGVRAGLWGQVFPGKMFLRRAISFLA
jgi:hypothetical protein